MFLHYKKYVQGLAQRGILYIDTHWSEHKNMKKVKKFAFSLTELMISIIIISLIAGAFAPVITKKLSASSIKLGSTGGDFNTNCIENCLLCQKDKCVLCKTGFSYDKETNTCINCSEKFNAYTLKCTSDEVIRCAKGYYIENNTCTKCPVGYYCPDGKTKNQCQAGYTTDGGAISEQECKVAFSEKAFTESTTWTVPSGVTKVKITLVGGGSGGENSCSVNYGSDIITTSQYWTIPTKIAGKTVTVEACGAGGETGGYIDSRGNDFRTFGGYGYYSSKSVDLSSYSYLAITIGTRSKTQGESRTYGACGSTCTGASGGGATYVKSPDGTELVVAGGGSGGANYASCNINGSVTSITCGGGDGERGDRGGARMERGTPTTRQAPSYFTTSYCETAKQGAVRVSFTGTTGGNGGASGKVYVKDNVSVTPGTNIRIEIGNAGAAGASGEDSYIKINSSIVATSASGSAVAGTAASGTTGGIGGVATISKGNLCTAAQAGQDANGYGCGGGGGTYPNAGGKGSSGYVLIQKI